jgi:HAD superfamily phosphoserine phosphatase-like hydrolase
LSSPAASSTWDLFIAHAGADKAIAEQLYDFLAVGARVFLDSRCLELGDEWDARLAAAQRASLVTVVLVSSNTVKAYYEREEVAAAIALARDAGERHRVVPVYLDSDADSGEAVPYGLRLKHGLRLSNQLTLSDAARELLALLQRLRAAASTSAALVPPRPGRVSEDRGILHQPPATWSSPVRRNRWRYKVVAFDLDGTLLRGEGFEFSWEAVWRGLAFGKGIQSKLKREYRQRSESDPSRANRIRAYQDWCENACAQFKSRGLTRDQLKAFSSDLSLTRNCRKALSDLRTEGVVTAIISGGINTFLEDAFPDYRQYVDFVFINELSFTPTGVLEGVHATAFDFQGKAEALDIVCERVGCSSAEAVFVGDHFNDEAIMLRVDKAIAYPPQDAVVSSVSHATIVKDDLLEIVPYILVE